MYVAIYIASTFCNISKLAITLSSYIYLAIDAVTELLATLPILNQPIFNNTVYRS